MPAPDTYVLFPELPPSNTGGARMAAFTVSTSGVGDVLASANVLTDSGGAEVGTAANPLRVADGGGARRHYERDRDRGRTRPGER